MSQFNLRYVPTLSTNEFILNGQRFNTQGANINGTQTTALTTEVIINDQTKNQALFDEIASNIHGNVFPFVQGEIDQLTANVIVLQGNVVSLQNQINLLNPNVVINQAAIAALQANTQYLRAPYNGQGGSTSYFLNGLQVWNGSNETGNGIFSYKDGSAPTNQIRLSVQNAKKIFLDGGSTLIAPTSGGNVDIQGSGGTQPFFFNLKNPGLLNGTIRVAGDIQLAGNGSSAISVYTQPGSLFPVPTNPIDRVDVRGGNETRIFGPSITVQADGGARMDLSGGTAAIQANNGDAVSIQCDSGSSNSDINIGTQQGITSTGYTTITLGSGNPTAIRNSSTFIEGDFYLPKNPATNTGLWDSLMYVGLPTFYSGPLHGPVKNTYNPYFRSISTYCPDSTVNSFVQTSGTFTVLVGVGAINLAAGAGGLTMSVAGGAMAYTALVGGMAFTTAAGAIQFTTGAGAYNITTGAGPIQMETNTGDILIHSGGAPGGVSGSTYITPKDYLILDPAKQVIIGESGDLPSFTTLINTVNNPPYPYNGNVFTNDISGNVVISNVFQTGSQPTYLRPINYANLTYTGNTNNPNTLYGNAYMTIVNASTNAVLYTSATTLITGTLNGFNFGTNQLLPASTNLVAKIYPEGNISNYQYGTWNSNPLVNSNIGVQINVEISGNQSTTTAYVNTFGNSYFQNELILNNYTPPNTTNALYNVSGSLYFNGSAIGGGVAGNYVSSIIAGNGITLSPTSGVGNVIVSVSGSVVPPGGYLPVAGGQMNGDILMAGNAAIYQGISGSIPKDQIKLYRPVSSYQPPFPNIAPPTYTGEMLTFYNGDNSPVQNVFTGWFPQSLFPYQPSAMTQQIPGNTGYGYGPITNSGTPQNISYVPNSTVAISQGQKFNVGTIYISNANTELPLYLNFGAPDFTVLSSATFAAGTFPSSGTFNFNLDITWTHGTETYWKVWWEQTDGKLQLNCVNPGNQFNNDWCGSLGYQNDPFYIVAVPDITNNQTVIYKWVEGLASADKLFYVDGTLNGIYEGQIGSSFLYFYGLFNNYVGATTQRVNNLFQWNVYSGQVYNVLSESTLVVNEPVGTNGAVRGIEVDTVNNRTWIYGDFDSYGTDANGNVVVGATDVELYCGCTFTKTDTWAIGPTVQWEGIRGFNGCKAGKLMDATANYCFMVWALERWDGSVFQPYSELGMTFFDGMNWLPNINANCLALNDGIQTVVSNIQFINDYSGGGYKIFFTGTFSSAIVNNVSQTCYSIAYTQGGGTFNSGTMRYQYGLNLCCNNQDATFWVAPVQIGISNLRRMSNGLMIMNTDGYYVSTQGGGVMSFDLSNIATPTASPTKYGISGINSYTTNVIVGTDATKVKLVAGLNTNNFFWSQILDTSPAPAPGDATVYAINGARFLVDNTEMDKIVFQGNNQNYSSVSFIAGKVEDKDYNWYWYAQVGAIDYFSGNVFYPNITAAGNVNGSAGTVPTLNAVLVAGNSAGNQSMTDLNNIGCLTISTGKVYQGNNLNLEIGESADSLKIKGATAKGSLLVGNGATTNELTVGANNYVLTANSAASLGVQWSPVVGNISAGLNITIGGTSTNPNISVSNPLTSTLNVGSQLISSSTGTIDITPLAGNDLNVNTSGVGKLHVITSGAAGASQPAMSVENTNGNANGVHIDLYKNSASPAANDDVGAISFHGQSSTGVKTEYGQIKTVIIDPTNASQNSSIVLSACVNSATPSAFLTCNGTFGYVETNKSLNTLGNPIITTSGAINLYQNLANQNIGLTNVATGGSIIINKSASGIGSVQITSATTSSFTSSGDTTISSSSGKIVIPQNSSVNPKLITDIANVDYYPTFLVDNNNSNTITIPPPTMMGQRLTLVNKGITPPSVWVNYGTNISGAGGGAYAVQYDSQGHVWVARKDTSTIEIYDNTITTVLGNVYLAGYAERAYCFYEESGFMYIGGSFTTVNGNPTNQYCITRINIYSYVEDPLYDGAGSYNGVDGSSSGYGVFDIASFNSVLYCGGLFSNIIGISSIPVANLIYIQNYTSSSGSQIYTEAHGGTNGKVNTLLNANSYLWVGGEFTQVQYLISPIGYNYLVVWNGSAWDYVAGNNLNGPVSCVENYCGYPYLIIAGSFTSPYMYVCHVDYTAPNNSATDTTLYITAPINRNCISYTGVVYIHTTTQGVFYSQSFQTWANYGTPYLGIPSFMGFWNSEPKVAFEDYDYIQTRTGVSQQANFTLSSGNFKFNTGLFTTASIYITDVGWDFVGDTTGSGIWRQTSYNPWGSYS